MERFAFEPRRTTLIIASVVVSLALASVGVALLEMQLAVPDASAVYLLAVVVIALGFGTVPAIVTAIGAFLSHDFLFIEPRFTFTVHDPGEWLNLILLLVVGIVVGRLAGQVRDRAIAAETREREARALFRISRALAQSPRAAAALPEIVASVLEETGMSRVWVTLGEGPAARVLSDSDGSAPLPDSPVRHDLLRQPGAKPATWVRIHAPKTPGRSSPTNVPSDSSIYRIAIEDADRPLGAVWGTRPRGRGDPPREESRVLGAAADQIGRALERDRLSDEAAAAEIARRSDVLKSALLDSVSHDLRTPLASVRAAAGTLMDPAVDWSPQDRLEIAASIDREAERLNQLVSNLLDMSRIESGELRPRTAVFLLDDLVAGALERSAVPLRGRTVTVDVATDLPPVEVDEVLIGQVLGNVLENASRYGGEHAHIRLSARLLDPDLVRLTIEDDGPGVPDDSLPRLVEKFYRVPRSGEGARRGTGMGLAVVQGLVEAMGGTVTARRSELGGLALDMTLRAAPRVPADGLDASAQLASRGDRA